MHFLRRSLVWLAILLLPLILVALASSFALVRSFGSPEPIKASLQETGIYGSAVDTFLSATDNPNEESQDTLSVDNPVVREAFKRAFPPQLVQDSSEKFIDSVFAWLEGETVLPDFRIDLRQAKATFVERVAAGAEARAAKLPVCSDGQTTFQDPFRATCLPPGVPASAAGDEIRRELAGGEEQFLKDPILTAGSIKSEDGEPAFSNSSLPETYQTLKDVPLILALAALVLLLAVVFLSDSRRQGLKRAGVVLLVVGVIIIIFSWLTTRVVNNQLAPNLIKLENSAALEEKLQALVKNVSERTGKNSMLAGAVYAGLGALAIGTKMYWDRRYGPHKTPVAETAKDTETDSEKAASKLSKKTK